MKSATGSFHLTDLGNARRLVTFHGRDLRYCHPWGKWLTWTGKRWAVDDSGEVDRRAKDVTRELWREVAECDDSDERKELATWARSCESSARIRSMIDLARSEPGVPVLPEDMDRNPWLFNCTSGTIDLRTGDELEHRREDLICQCALADYEPDMPAPIWEAFVHRIFDGKADLIRFVRRLLGWCLTGDVSEQLLPFFHGAGANGKSVLVGAVQGILGPDYAMKAPPDLLMMRGGDSHPTERADLFRKRFVACVETEDGRRLAESLVKELTGGDRVRARRMREDFWEFSPTHKIVLASNHKPRIRGTDHGIWRRVRLVPFDVTIPEGERDKQLPSKLEAEYPGILAWLVRGCLEWQRDGLGCPPEVMAATDRYRRSEDVVSQFVEECCRLNDSDRESAGALYATYKRWATEQGDRPMTQRRFGEQLGTAHPKVSINGRVWYVGLSVNHTEEGF